MGNNSYKKYMKQDEKKDYNLIKIFIISFLGMLLVFTFLIKVVFPTADVSVGDYQRDNEQPEVQQNIDGRLSMIQEEDREQNFKELFGKTEEPKADENIENKNTSDITQDTTSSVQRETQGTPSALTQPTNTQTPIYKVFIGTYTSMEQAKVAKDIISESGANYNMIVKCLGTNNYTIQVGSFKNRVSAETLLYSLQQEHLPGRIVQEY